MNKESIYRRALQDLVDAMERKASPGSTYFDGPSRHVVSLSNPLIVSAIQQARTVLRPSSEERMADES